METPPTARAALLDAPGLYLTGEDHLRLTTFGGVAGATVVLEGRLVTIDGRVVPLAETHTPNSNYTSKANTFALAEGVLTNVQLRASSASLLGGGVFAVLEVVRGLTANAQALATLLQGYVTTNARLAWPGSPIGGPTTGAGRIRAIVGTDPAAGVEVSETVPAGARWKLLSFRARLVTSAAVANRFPALVIDDGANILTEQYDNTTVVASTTRTYQAGVYGMSGAISGAFGNLALPENLVLAAGFRIR